MSACVLRLATTATLTLLAATLDLSAQSADRVGYTVAPNEADPGVRRFLRNSVVRFDRAVSPQAPLLVFLPGTGGDPAGVRLFLDVAADAGYRVVSLSYDNEPEVMQICARDPDPACPGDCRQSRVFGGSGPTPVDTPPGEAIVARLTKLLQLLESRHPDEGWRGYLVDGAPDWHRIAVSGHSQGGGMAAFLAKRVALARVLLLSGPVDYVLPSRAGRIWEDAVAFGQSAPWLAAASATPIDRWYGLYHRDERFAPLLVRAYAALGLLPIISGRSDSPPRRHRASSPRKHTTSASSPTGGRRGRPTAARPMPPTGTSCSATPANPGPIGAVPAGGINTSIASFANWLLLHLDQGEFEGKPLLSPTLIQQRQTLRVMSQHPNSPTLA